MRLVAWNVNGRVDAALERQADALLSETPDLVCLQEVTAASEARWRERLAEAGLRSCASSVPLIGLGRRYANLIACRWPLALLPAAEFEIPYPEKVLSAVVCAPERAVELHVAHLPPGVSRPQQKVETFEGIHARLARPALRPRILCGDFNSPQSESPDGTIATWAPRGADFARWDAAERSVLSGLADHDLGDVFRRLHGHDPQPTTWQPRGRDPQPRRYDHVFASASLSAESCDYRHEWRESGLSDHSGVVAVFA